MGSATKVSAQQTEAHFGPGLFRFLKELRANNNRSWFQANKDRYPLQPGGAGRQRHRRREVLVLSAFGAECPKLKVGVS